MSEFETNSVKPLLRRVELFLEDGDWGKADEYCERALDTDPENAQAYLGKRARKVFRAALRCRGEHTGKLKKPRGDKK